MQAVTITQISPSELESLIENSIKKVVGFQTHEHRQTKPQEQLLTIKQAADFLNLSVPTLYTKVSKGELPVMKRGNRLYFSSTELMEYLKGGRKKSNTEIKAEAEKYLSETKKG